MVFLPKATQAELGGIYRKVEGEGVTFQGVVSGGRGVYFYASLGVNPTRLQDVPTTAGGRISPVAVHSLVPFVAMEATGGLVYTLLFVLADSATELTTFDVTLRLSSTVSLTAAATVSRTGITYSGSSAYSQWQVNFPPPRPSFTPQINTDYSLEFPSGLPAVLRPGFNYHLNIPGYDR